MLPRWGIDASAYAAFVCYLVMIILAYIIGQRKYPIDYPVRSMVLLILVLVGLLYACHFIMTHGLVVNSLIGTGFIILYLGICYLLEKTRIRKYLWRQ